MNWINCFFLITLMLVNDFFSQSIVNQLIVVQTSAHKWKIKKNWIFKCVCVLNLQVRTKTAQQCVEFFYLDKKLHEKQEKQKQENQVGGLEQQTGVRTLFFHFFLSNSVVPPFQTIWNNSINRSRGEPTMKEPERTPIPNGVPQRPVLGPVLYPFKHEKSNLWNHF